MKRKKGKKRPPKDDLSINIDGSSAVSPTTPSDTTTSMGLSPTATEATDDTPLGNGFLSRVQRLRQNVSRGAANTARRTKDAMVDLKEDAGSMLSSLGDDFALKIEELDGQTDISDNWKEVCKEKANEEHRQKLEEQAMERAKRDADRSVSDGISEFRGICDQR